jgi:tRNA (uracil-5-)-methyltransferase TRM9
MDNNPSRSSIPQSATGFHAMRAEVQDRLLALNTAFYATVANDFDQTRMAVSVGMAQVAARCAPILAKEGCTMIDVGCGNGRFAWALDRAGVVADYIGVDNESQLLARACTHADALLHVQTAFVQADLANAAWVNQLPPKRRFDLIVCLATLQHFPAYARRRRLVAEMAGLLAPQGLLVISGWQFLGVARFRHKQIAWETLDLHDDDVEPGDALLPWQQGHHAVRFVHQIDLPEMNRLAADAGLTVAESWRADGKEGDLNLFAFLKAR